MKTCLHAGLVTALLSGAVSALPSDTRDRARLFAGCAGRMSALMEHQWMFDGAASDRTKKVRAGFVALVEASVGQGVTGRDALNWRIDAKMAQARLLQLATFSDDARIVRQARRRADLYLAECENLLLG
ncbi:hypothetical protein ACOXXX_04755 [Thalassococcus sp. BH17M4-6]|uniref:hypothetical protein n=1 Tax=Thalassococcus sp. BH17M4-6 TaxID=3413148 RepID=UPI003BC492F3